MAKPIEFDFMEDAVELRRSLEGLRNDPGLGWLEEIAFDYPLRLIVGTHSLLSSTSAQPVMTVGPHGQHVSTELRDQQEPLRVPLAHIVTTLPSVIDAAIRDRRATWSLPGGASISFAMDEVDPGLVHLEVSPTRQRDAVPIQTLSAQARDLVGRARDYLRTYLPDQVWRRWNETLK